MEKKLVITVVILTALINIYYFWHMNKNTADIRLFDKTEISFYFRQTEDKAVSKPEFLKKIKNFSEKNNIEIAQYSFLSSDKIDIYSTMKETYKEAFLIPVFIYNRDIKVHNFENLLDVGFKNLFYIDTKDKGIIQELSDELKDDCDLYYLESPYHDSKTLFTKLVNNDDNNFLPVFILFIFLFILIIFFYYSKSRQAYVIYRLWGYTRIQIYCILNKSLYKPLFFTIILSSLAMSGMIYKFIFSNLLFEVLFMMLAFHTAVVLLLFLLSMALFAFSFAAVDNKNRKKGQEKIIMAACASKLLLLLCIIFFCENLFNQKVELHEQIDSLTLWQNTKNLFNLNETYSPFYAENLANEDILNDKILKVYKDLSALDKVFIIKTINFERSRKEHIHAGNEMDYDYAYKATVQNEKDLYAPDTGRNIVVDKNYLKRHPIKTTDGKNVMDLIDNNDDVLNILVPQNYKNKESMIESTYKEWFYFQKVEAANIYREACRQNRLEKNIDDLKINIIYADNNQRYFTYNQNSGNEMNTIMDPIVTVYTENVDNSFLASCLGDYMLVESQDEYSALKEVSTITQKYNVMELNSITSVYDKKGQEIKDLEDSIDRFLLNTVIAFLLLIMFMAVITYACYKTFFPIIMIKSLYGYGFASIYKRFILANLYINILIVPFGGVIYKKISLYMIIAAGLISVTDYLAAGTINRYLLKKGEIQFIKGEFK